MTGLGWMDMFFGWRCGKINPNSKILQNLNKNNLNINLNYNYFKSILKINNLNIYLKLNNLKYKTK
jgi:hypothetical protein